MTREPLGDDEKEALIAAMTAYKTGTLTLAVVIKQVNNILLQRDKGLDSCARPISSRSEKDMNETCFAKGYIRKIISFMEETESRNLNVVSETKTYADNILEEIDAFMKE